MTEVWGLLFQAGMVGVFIFFSLQMETRHATERKDRDEQWQEFLASESKKFSEAVSMRDELWAERLAAERNQRTASTTASNESLLKLAEAIGDHDLNAQKRHEKVLEILAEIRSMLE